MTRQEQREFVSDLIRNVETRLLADENWPKNADVHDLRNHIADFFDTCRTRRGAA